MQSTITLTRSQLGYLGRALWAVSDAIWERSGYEPTSAELQAVQAATQDQLHAAAHHAGRKPEAVAEIREDIAAGYIPSWCRTVSDLTGVRP
jgi:hypothetical protein